VEVTLRQRATHLVVRHEDHRNIYLELDILQDYEVVVDLKHSVLRLSEEGPL
jgi:hypothetical protein